MILTNPAQEQLSKIKDFILQHPDGNFFHSPSAFNFFKSVENYQPFMITNFEDDNLNGILSGIIMKESSLKGFFSKRCVVWGGPVCYNQETAKALIEELDEYVSNKSIYTEYRNLFDISDLQDIFIKAGYEFEDRINYIVAIETLEENRKKLNQNRRRQINKSLKSGAKIILPTNPEQIKQFYTILNDLYKTKVKKPLPSYEFFEKFYEQKETGKYLLIEFCEKIIGGIMCPVYKDTIYELYVCGLDSEFKDQSPSVLATWAAIEYAANNGLKYFDFMGAGKLDDNYGVREFKSKFGGKEVRFGRYVKINKPILYWIGKTGLKVLQKVR